MLGGPSGHNRKPGDLSATDSQILNGPLIRARHAGRFLAEGDIGLKGQSLLILSGLIENGILDPGRFSVPEFKILPAGALKTPDLSLETLTQRAISDPNFKLSLAKEIFESSEVLQNFLNSAACTDLAGVGRLMVRSMHDYEGGSGESFAGVFLSRSADSYPGSIKGAVIEVIASSFSPLALLLYQRHGLEPRVSGLIFQREIKANGYENNPPTFATLNTAIPGTLQGFVTLNEPIDESGVNFQKFIRPVRFSVKNPSRRQPGLPDKLQESLLELVKSLDNGNPFEIELAYDPVTEKTYIFQYRTVKPLSGLEFPRPGSSPIAVTSEVTGSGLAVSNQVLYLRGNQYFGSSSRPELLAAYLLAKQIENAGEDFIVLTDQLTLHSVLKYSERGDNLGAMIFNKALAVIETPPYFHNSCSRAHFYRLMSDSGSIFLGLSHNPVDSLIFEAGGVYPQADDGVKVINPDPGLWQPQDNLYVPSGQRYADDLPASARWPNVFAVKLKRKLVVAAEQIKGEGAVYLAG
ncbi:MAG: hypothetical protein D6719_13265 [Candidatus Dadabacteria bacterium]|nr:MAG: hypothetical protein D6719_13265 [Candidatus Dadabacteria bacterium]